jgi:wobble nucleotide-excising tRNase
VQIEVTEKANESSKLKIESFSAYLKTLSSQFISNKEILNNKSKEPSRAVELISVKEQLENMQLIIESANKEIKKHNEIVANYSNERSKLISEIWMFLVKENKTNIERFSQHQTGLQKGIDAITKIVDDLRLAYKKLDSQIKELAKTVTSIQPSVDEINKTLNSFGFQNFEIVPSKTGVNQYQIQREDGTLAESTLSEGEITFITFLYYLQLAKGSTTEENITNERILVVDDPISSLDSNVLFVVSTLLKEIIKALKKDEGNIKQIILLTHNVYFHKEVSFIDGRTNESGDTFYWIIRKNENITSIQPFGLKNPIQNSYELLWQELKNKDSSSGLTIQNTMRRIIENYFKILGKYGDDELINKFHNQQEQEICRSLICWINDGSHGIPDDLFVEYQENTIGKYNRVFKNIFKETGHIEHYNMMMT